MGFLSILRECFPLVLDLMTFDVQIFRPGVTMQPTERMTESNPVDPRPRPGDKDLLRDSLRDQADRGRSKFDIVLLSVQRLLHRGAITNLAKMLGRMHQADVAQVIMHLSSPKEKREVFELVRGESKRGQVLSELDSDSINQVLADLLHSDIAWLIKDLGPDDAAYLLGVLPEERAKEILALMRAEDSTEVADLLKYPKDTAGGIMTTEFFALSEDATAQDAIRRLQLATDAEMVFYIYVTDKDERLVGGLSCGSCSRSLRDATEKHRHA